MSVSAILEGKAKDIITTKPETKVAEVAELLAKNRIGAVIVCNNDSSVAGIISERDIVRDIANIGAGALEHDVSLCMTKSVVSCGRNDTIDHLMEVMTTNHFRHMPVVENNKLVGIISIGDVVKRKIWQAEQDARDMRDYIAS